jgi:flagellar biosynthesis/type III secretory pathway protein FliH
MTLLSKNCHPYYQVIQALNAELQSLKRKEAEQQSALADADAKLQKEREQVGATEREEGGRAGFRSCRSTRSAWCYVCGEGGL